MPEEDTRKDYAIIYRNESTRDLEVDLRHGTTRDAVQHGGSLKRSGYTIIRTLFPSLTHQEEKILDWSDQDQDQRQAQLPQLLDYLNPNS